jgi:D-glycero-D-manno-heptose 1,7-bisphosphate phosphatase
MTGNTNLRPAIFLDRDGTLNRIVYNQEGNEDSPFRPEDLELLPGAGEFTRRVREAGYLAILATNQPGVAKGSVTVAGLDRIHEHLLALLAKDGGGLDRICYCPHHPVGRPGVATAFVQTCDCRKPAAGMLLRAGREMGVDFKRSWMIGDKVLDVKAGQAAGCRTILLTISQAEASQKLQGSLPPDYIASDLSQALEIVLASNSL